MTLDKLLSSLEPERSLLEVERRADEALSTFSFPGGSALDWDEFRDAITRFFRHATGAILGLGDKVPVYPELHFGQACRLLMKEFGPDGDKAAAKMAIHGVEGGLYQVCKVIARRLAEEHSENMVKSRIAEFWNPLSADQKLATAQEYIAKYGHLLPPDVTENKAGRILAFLPKFLEKHPQLIARLRVKRT